MPSQRKQEALPGSPFNPPGPQPQGETQTHRLAVGGWCGGVGGRRNTRASAPVFPPPPAQAAAFSQERAGYGGKKTGDERKSTCEGGRRTNEGSVVRENRRGGGKGSNKHTEESCFVLPLIGSQNPVGGVRVRTCVSVSAVDVCTLTPVGLPSLSADGKMLYRTRAGARGRGAAPANQATGPSLEVADT